MTENNPIGALLVKRGVMTQTQVLSVLNEQKTCEKPFCRLAREMYNISSRDIFLALAEQMHDTAQQINVTQTDHDPHAERLIDSNEAWQNRVLPIRQKTGKLSFATTSEHLPAAIELLETRGFNTFDIVLANPRELDQMIAQRFCPGNSIAA